KCWTREQRYFVRVAHRQHETQAAQVSELLNMEDPIDVLVIGPVDGERSAELVEMARRKGIKVMAYDRLIKKCTLDYYLSFDNALVGRMQAEYVALANHTKGNYVLLEGSPIDNNAHLFKSGHLAVLKPLIEKGDVKVVFETFVDGWNAELGKELFGAFLDENPDLMISAVLAANDNLARGAYQALSERGRESGVLITGQDSNLDACQRIVNDQQNMTVYKPIEAIAYSAAINAVKIAKGHPTEFDNTKVSINNETMEVPAILMSPVLVDRTTMETTVIADGYWTKEDIYPQGQPVETAEEASDLLEEAPIEESTPETEESDELLEDMGLEDLGM
ncbi:MAG: sugar ABC transporter substrate-binding protein, partial [Cytophagales bacterium]|nr:sugar ABC transporter substrate-binding protein [Cytophagales bacterium]